MSRCRPDKSLVKIYKDLIVTKRQLIDLRQSIYKTLSELRTQNNNMRNRVHSYQQNQLPQYQFTKKVCFDCGFYYEPAAPHSCCPSYIICEVCNGKFITNEQLQQHQSIFHSGCKKCGQKTEYDQKSHYEFQCGETKIECERCFAEIRRKQLNDHVSKCLFQMCPKCKQNIYFKAFVYHSRQCRIKTNPIAISNKIKRSLKPYNRKYKNKKVDIFPCSLMQ